MKALNQTTRTLAYKIECARFSFRILETQWRQLRSVLSVNGDPSVSEEIAIELMSAAWQIVDFSARYLNVLNTIVGFPKKDLNFVSLVKIGRSLTKVRNYIQHVDHESHKHNGAETYPILGALAWSGQDGKSSTSMCIGTMPTETSFHTLGFDKVTGKYVDDVILGVGNQTLSLLQLYDTSATVSVLLNDWLRENKLLNDEELLPNVLRFEGVPDVSNDMRFIRVKFKMGGLKTA